MFEKELARLREQLERQFWMDERSKKHVEQQYIAHLRRERAKWRDWWVHWAREKDLQRQLDEEGFKVSSKQPVAPRKVFCRFKHIETYID